MTVTFESGVLMTTSLPRQLFFSASNLIPMNSMSLQTASRKVMPFSPMPAVNTTTSTPPISAA